MKHIHFKTIDSTNTYLATHYQELDHMTALSSDYQSQGKGRMDRIWYGDEHSIMCSILLKEHLDEKTIMILPLLAAKSFHHVLSRYHQDIKIKWPNDLLIHGLKLSGILVRSIIESQNILAVIVGFGININQQSFNDEIKGIATSLYLETGISYDKNDIMDELIKQFETDLASIQKDKQKIIDYCNHYSAINHHEVSFTYQNQTYQGIVQHINHEGHLVIKVKDQVFVINSGDVTSYQLNKPLQSIND